MNRSHLLQGYISENLTCFESEQYYALENMRTCRTIVKGGRILHCNDCGTDVVVYNPCNQRGCPVCSKKNQIQWAEKLKAKLLPTGHYHLVFSLPDELIEVWKLDKTTFINTFFHSVQKAFKQIQKDMGITLGVVMVFQSHGRALCYKPHMHCIVTNHGIDENNKWVSCGALKYNTLRDVVKKTFIPHLIKKIHPWWRKVLKNTFGSIDERKWTVYPAIHKFNGESIVNYLSKSVSGLVVDIENDLDYNRDEMTYTIRDRRMGKERSTTLEASVFWDRYLNHIPPKGTVTIRNYGLYSNKYSSLLERIRIKEFPAQSSTEKVADNQEKCCSCHGIMETKETFTHTELPLVMRLHIQKNHSPPENGFSFKSAKITLK